MDDENSEEELAISRQEAETHQSNNMKDEDKE